MIQIGGIQSNTTTIQSQKIHLAAVIQQPEQNIIINILLSGVVEEKVYTGKCVDLNENLGNWAQYKMQIL